ncbi:MAG: HmuY family protein, partial [Bacteroidota bacterium]
MLSRLLPLAALLVALPLGAQTQRAENVAVGGSGMGGPAGPFTFYSLAENRVVPNADSASTAWDLALRGTTILVNGGTSGPGEGRAAIVEAPYDDVTSVAEADLRADGEGDCPRGANAICTGSGNGWYLYESATVSQIEGRTIVVRPATGGTP